MACGNKHLVRAQHDAGSRESGRSHRWPEEFPQVGIIHPLQRSSQDETKSAYVATQSVEHRRNKACLRGSTSYLELPKCCPAMLADCGRE